MSDLTPPHWGTPKRCDTCAYDMGPSWDDCKFPDPQDGSDPPFMAPASMPSRRDGGMNCHHYQKAKDQPCHGDVLLRLANGGGE